MKVDVTFVNFPVSEPIRQIVSEKIQDHVAKFATKVANARAVFSQEGPNQTVKLHVTSGGINTFVSATDTDVSRCVDQILDKLDASLRKIHNRKKDRRHDISTQEKLAIAGKNFEDQTEDGEDEFQTAVG